MRITEVRKILKELGRHDVFVRTNRYRSIPVVEFRCRDRDFITVKDGLSRGGIIHAVEIVTGEQQ